MVRDCTNIEECYRESLDFLQKFESRNLSFDNTVGKSLKGSEKSVIAKLEEERSVLYSGRTFIDIIIYSYVEIRTLTNKLDDLSREISK